MAVIYAKATVIGGLPRANRCDCLAASCSPNGVAREQCDFSGKSHSYILWNFPLKSHFADAAEAQPQAPPVQSSEIARHPSCRRRSPAPLPSCSWTCRRRRGATHLRYPSPARPAERYPGFGHFVRIDRRIAPDGRRRLCQIAVSMTPGMDRADPDAIA